MLDSANEQAFAACPSVGRGFVTGRSDLTRWGEPFDGKDMLASRFRARSWSPDGSRLIKDGDPDSKTVMVVPLIGHMSKYGSWNSYGTAEIAAQLSAAASDGKVIAVVLDIDSGGGYTNAIPPLVDAIDAVRAAGKPVVAHADACYSAAYWVASQCDALFLDNPLSGCGSIGVFAELFDDRENKLYGHRWISIYPPESKDKNLAVRDALDGKTETMEKELSVLACMFRDAVLKGRPGLKEDTPGLLTGAEFMAEEALAAGMCDGIMNLRGTIEAAAVRAEFGK